MIAALVAAGVVALALTTLAVYAITATRRAGSEQARADVLAVRWEAAIANAKTEAARADFEKGRADALDAAIVEAAAAGPIAGSYERLLQARRGAGSADRRSADVVRDAGADGGETRAVGPDDLLEPGE